MFNAICATVIVVLLIAVILLHDNYRHVRAEFIKLQSTRNEWEKIATERHAVAHNYLNACRLIAIHRNGRMNVFTFARGDKIFSIETMGLWEDNVDQWKQQAGIE